MMRSQVQTEESYSSLSSYDCNAIWLGPLRMKTPIFVKLLWVVVIDIFNVIITLLFIFKFGIARHFHFLPFITLLSHVLAHFPIVKFRMESPFPHISFPTLLSPYSPMPLHIFHWTTNSQNLLN